jgi:hypothetical protein
MRIGLSGVKPTRQTKKAMLTGASAAEQKMAGASRPGHFVDL